MKKHKIDNNFLINFCWFKLVKRHALSSRQCKQNISEFFTVIETRKKTFEEINLLWQNNFFWSFWIDVLGQLGWVWRHRWLKIAVTTQSESMDDMRQTCMHGIHHIWEKKHSYTSQANHNRTAVKQFIWNCITIYLKIIPLSGVKLSAIA